MESSVLGKCIVNDCYFVSGERDLWQPNGSDESRAGAIQGKWLN